MKIDFKKEGRKILEKMKRSELEDYADELLNENMDLETKIYRLQVRLKKAKSQSK